MDDKYIRLGQIGHGSYSTVYKYQNKETKEFLAVKKLKIWFDENKLDTNTVKEIEHLKLLQHENIIKIIDSFKDESWFIFMEYTKYDLRYFMDYHTKTITPELIVSFTVELLTAISFIHSNNIVHLDIKPQNILISENNTLKITDFGGSEKLEFTDYFKKGHDGEYVSLWYRAPEILFCDSFGHSADIWSIGLILYELLCKGYILFRGNSENDQLDKIFQILGTPNDNSYPGFSKLTKFKDVTFPKYNKKDLFPSSNSIIINIILKMLNYNQNERITARDALNILNLGL